MCHCRVCVVLQAQADALRQQIAMLEQQVTQLKESSDANGSILQRKTATLTGRSAHCVLTVHIV